MMSRLESARQGKVESGCRSQQKGWRDGKPGDRKPHGACKLIGGQNGKQLGFSRHRQTWDRAGGWDTGPERLDTLSWNSLAGRLFYRGGN